LKEIKMKVNRTIILLVITLLVLGLAACERSLSPSVAKKPATKAPASGIATATNAVIDNRIRAATQTAVASELLNKPSPLPPTAIPPSDTPAAVVPPTQAQAVEQQATPTAPPPAPVAPAVSAPIPTTGVPTDYSLQKGEFPYCIARRFNVNPSELLSINGLGPNTLLSAGMILRIPQSGNPFPGNRMLRPHPSTHIVAYGDSIYSIACLFGDVDPMAIAAVNNIAAPYTLTPGQTLQIP
jgi:LysM repeat protein